MTTDYEVKGAFGGAYWIDLLGPAVGINPPGAVSDPGRDPNTGWWLFDKDATEQLLIQAQMPHGWVEGSSVRFHVHWHKSSSASGDVAWRMRYRRGRIGAAWSAWSAPETVTVPVISDQDTAEWQALTAFTPIPMPDCKVSAGLLIELARVGSADSYGADAVLTDADCHVLVNQAGSVEEYLKYRPELQWPRRT